jgi:hypothetical protein
MTLIIDELDISSIFLIFYMSALAAAAGINLQKHRSRNIIRMSFYIITEYQEGNYVTD